jgi:hypothetical protein
MGTRRKTHRTKDRRDKGQRTETAAPTNAHSRDPNHGTEGPRRKTKTETRTGETKKTGQKQTGSQKADAESQKDVVIEADVLLVTRSTLLARGP